MKAGLVGSKSTPTIMALVSFKEVIVGGVGVVIITIVITTMT